nr:sulfotransferase [Salinibacter ruber]
MVTGSHRSGTTWVGRMLALPPVLRYVHEPFRPDASHDLVPLPTKRWYEYIPSNGENERYRVKLEKGLGLRYPLGHHLKASGSLRDGYRHVRSAVGRTIDRWRGRSVLLKDPLALLSAEWLYEQFDLDVVVMIRHPVAFAGSLKVKGWTFPFQDLLDQSRAMKDLFWEHREEIQHFAKTDQHIVDQAALLWTLLYNVVLKYRKQQPDWVFLRHEDIARSPLQTFQGLYDQFGLDFTNTVRSQIEAHSDPAEKKSTVEDLQRDSESVIRNWVQRLTADEIKRVRKRTASVASEFYSEDEW